MIHLHYHTVIFSKNFSFNYVLLMFWNVNSGTFCPYNSQNTLHHYNALWALLIPISTTFRVCDVRKTKYQNLITFLKKKTKKHFEKKKIWRSYWAQRVLWEIDSHLMFGAPSVYQDRNEHNYLDDFLDEGFETFLKLFEILIFFSFIKQMLFMLMLVV